MTDIVTNPLTQLAPVNAVSTEEINRIHARATEIHEAFVRKIDKLEDTARENADRYAQTVGVSVENAAGKPAAKKAIADNALTFRRNLVESTKAERWELIREIAQKEGMAETFREVYPSPAAYLGLVGLGDPRKTQIIQQLNDAGYVALQVAARYAIASRDMLAASAVAAVVDTLPKNERPYSFAQIAEAAAGDVWREIDRKLADIRRMNQAVLNANREFEYNRASPVSKVASGIGNRDTTGAGTQAALGSAVRTLAQK